MKNRIPKWFILVCILPYAHLRAISIVYNFRIAQITKQPIFEENNTQHHSVIALLFDQYQKKYHGDSTQNFAGGLSAYIYNARSYYFRVDTAASHIHSTTNHITTFSGIKTDDILITIGRNFKLNALNSTTFSVLFGMPTHCPNILKHTDFGYGQVGTGVQIDGSYDLQHKNHFLYGLRYNYFVPRTARDEQNNKYRFTIGNIGDLLFGYKHNWTHHGLEFGYTQRWDFGAAIRPHLDDIVKKINYTRSNFYFVYKYIFSINNLEHRFLFDVSYGFDQKPKKYGNKYIITVWGAWNIRF